MKKVEVFEGSSLQDLPIGLKVGDPRCAFIGRTRSGKQIQVPLDENILSRHLMLIGGIGTGKTTAFFRILKQLQYTLTDKDVMVIFDTKGDFYSEFYREGDVVISNDSHACGPNRPDYWNIFNEIELDEHMEENISEIAAAVFSDKIENSNQPFFANAAMDIFAGILTHFCRNKEELAPNNAELRKLMDFSNVEGFKRMLSKHRDFVAVNSYISKDGSSQTMGVISELQQAIRRLFVGNFKKEGTLSVRNLVRQKGGRKIFIEYDMGIGSTLAPIYTLLYDLAIKEALCRSKSEGNVYFVADEFRLIPNLRHIDDAVNFGRGMGVKFMVGIQNVEQIYDVYGEMRARSILSGFLTSVAFRVNDAASRDFVKELHGANRKMEIYMASNRSKGVTEQIRDSNVVEDRDISTLSIGEAIIGLPNIQPFILKFRYGG